MPLIGELERYQHVERLGHADVEGLLDGEVVVQEKLDGANMTVALLPEPYGLTICSRNQAIYHSGEVINDFNGAVQWVLDSKIPDLLKHFPDWILRGEWLVRHSINYPKDALKKFYVFDVQVEDGTYLHVDEYSLVLSKFDVPMVPLLTVYSEGVSAKVLGEQSASESLLGDVGREGIVVKRYDYRNKWGRVVWGKVVAADFREKNKLHKGATKRDDLAIRIASKLEEEFILKEIYKVRDEQDGLISVVDMPKILGRVKHHFFHEELWDQVKRIKGSKVVDFQRLFKLLDAKTRDVALAFFNGVLE